ncbi:hypothetical protein [Bradyrhizobium sp. WD16]|uniref:hypothetical protein n=1 Tax=Bradyrhizobium sp. WD16 TaxID=1521768 RepID=UPI0020A43F3A|nr:hypothetical protein [Bradyrhizobium sp. WD16]
MKLMDACRIRAALAEMPDHGGSSLNHCPDAPTPPSTTDLVGENVNDCRLAAQGLFLAIIGIFSRNN